MDKLDTAIHYGLTRAKPDSAAHVLATAVERARDYLNAHPYPGRDEYERGSIIAMQVVLGLPLGRAS